MMRAACDAFHRVLSAMARSTEGGIDMGQLLAHARAAERRLGQAVERYDKAARAAPAAAAPAGPRVGDGAGVGGAAWRRFSPGLFATPVARYLCRRTTTPPGLDRTLLEAAAAEVRDQLWLPAVAPVGAGADARETAPGAGVLEAVLEGLEIQVPFLEADPALFYAQLHDARPRESLILEALGAAYTLARARELLGDAADGGAAVVAAQPQRPDGRGEAARAALANVAELVAELKAASTAGGGTAQAPILGWLSKSKQAVALLNAAHGVHVANMADKRNADVSRAFVGNSLKGRSLKSSDKAIGFQHGLGLVGTQGLSPFVRDLFTQLAARASAGAGGSAAAGDGGGGLAEAPLREALGQLGRNYDAHGLPRALRAAVAPGADAAAVIVDAILAAKPGPLPAVGPDGVGASAARAYFDALGRVDLGLAAALELIGAIYVASEPAAPPAVADAAEQHAVPAALELLPGERALSAKRRRVNNAFGAADPPTAGSRSAPQGPAAAPSASALAKHAAYVAEALRCRRAWGFFGHPGAGLRGPHASRLLARARGDGVEPDASDAVLETAAGELSSRLGMRPPAAPAPPAAAQDVPAGRELVAQLVAAIAAVLVSAEPLEPGREQQGGGARFEPQREAIARLCEGDAALAVYADAVCQSAARLAVAEHVRESFRRGRAAPAATRRSKPRDVAAAAGAGTSRARGGASTAGAQLLKVARELAAAHDGDAGQSGPGSEAGSDSL